MKTINGFSINFDFSKLIKVADLIYYDGPLLSHYVSNKGENYLFYWVDVDNEYNRWVVIRTDIFSIQQYLAYIIHSGFISGYQNRYNHQEPVPEKKT